MHSGYIAAATFLLLTGTGACAQVVKLHRRAGAFKRGEISREQIYAGLLPVRELWSCTAFLLFALSGATRPYTDYFLIASRVPVVVITTIIIFYLARCGASGARRCLHLVLAGDAILAAVLLAVCIGGVQLPPLAPRFVDGAVALVGALLVYGKLSQAREMHRTRQSEAVSWIREGGLVVKDLTGLYYAATVGLDLLFIGITHALSIVSSTTICAVKHRLESKHPTGE